MASGPSWNEMVAQARREVGEIDAPDLAALRSGAEAGELVLIDVREDDEWARGRIPGASHIPLGELGERVEDAAFAGEISEADRARPVVVYCAGGVRSLVGAAVLKRMGFASPVSLKGGIREWAARGGEAEGVV